jgi:hypothetical protein
MREPNFTPRHLLRDFTGANAEPSVPWPLLLVGLEKSIFDQFLSDCDEERGVHP